MNKYLRMCLNWRVLTSLAVVGLGVWVVAPSLIAGVLPLLFLAVCPLSMILMMRGMQSHGEHAGHASVSRNGEGSEERQLERLKGQLSDVQRQQQTIVRQIEQLEREPGRD